MKWLKTILNSTLAVALLMATTGMTLNKHYCMGKLKAIAINETASPCVDADGAPIQMPCCDDISEELKIDEITQILFDFDSTPDLYQLAIINFVLLEHLDFSGQTDYPKFQYYSPPLPDRDIPILVQSFLI